MKDINMEELRELKYKYAYIQGNPIVNPNQMPEEIEVEVSDDIDDTVETLVEEHTLVSLATGANERLVKLLEQKLCSFEGSVLVYDHDEFLELILEEGQLWYGKDCYLADMEMGKCHLNSIEFNDLNPDCPIVVGFGLSEYGFWYNHTWLVTSDDEDNKTSIIETTQPCELYFGVVLTQSEIARFKENYRE